jgi:hypothetical protein
MSEANGRNGATGILGTQVGRRNDRQAAGRRPPPQHWSMQPMTHEHDTVVVDDGRESGSGMGAILGIIAILVLLVAVWYFALGPGTGTTNNNTTINNGGANQPAATQEIPNPVSS